MYMSSQNQPIASGFCLSLIREPGPVQRREKKIPRSVSCELASRAVGTVRAGGESHHEDARLRVAKAGDRFSPIFASLYALRFTRATSSRHSTRRGHLRHWMIS